MIELTQEQRAFIIWSLAHCKDPDSIVYDFNKRWNPKPPCATADVGACGPRRLTGEWLDYFNQEREAFLDAPTTDKRVRMALLNRVITDLESRRADPKSLLAAIELMAKEQADFFKPKAAAAGVQVVAAVTSIQRTIIDPAVPAPEPPY